MIWHMPLSAWIVCLQRESDHRPLKSICPATVALTEPHKRLCHGVLDVDHWVGERSLRDTVSFKTQSTIHVERRYLPAMRFCSGVKLLQYLSVQNVFWQIKHKTMRVFWFSLSKAHHS